MLTITKIRLFLWLILLITAGWLVWQALVPSGQISYVYDFQHPNIFISELKPVERTLLPKDGMQQVIGDPIYFDLYTPRHFDQARVTLTFQNTAEVPVIEMGLLQNETSWQFITKSIQNKWLDQLLSSWTKIRQDEIWFLQRQPNYDSLEAFWQQPATAEQIAVYNYQPPQQFTLPNYRAMTTQQTFVYQLRGDYQFYTYIANETLSFDWLIKDLNLEIGSDQTEVVVYNSANEMVGSIVLPDDDNVSDNGLVSQPRLLSLQRPNLPTGVYKIAVKANQDIITTAITTKQQYLSFINQIQLFAPEQKNIVLYTDSPILLAQTDQADGLQDIAVNSRLLKLNHSHEQVILTGLDKVNTIQLANGGLILSGQGVFSLQRNGLLNPNLQQVNSYFQLSDNINYVMANYNQPISTGEWQTTTVGFPLSGAELLAGKYRFMLSLPGLIAEDDVADSIVIKEIKIDLTGKPLWQKLREKLQ
ncbi:MAG: hypothetical protein V1765_00900 [bacterium]